MKSNGLDDKPEIRLDKMPRDSRIGLLPNLENASLSQEVPQLLLDTSGGFLL